VNKIIWETNDTEFPIQLSQQAKNRFTVVYGLQIDERLTYASAASILGQAIMHASACAGKLKN
jgi:hypothetical protein